MLIPEEYRPKPVKSVSAKTGKVSYYLEYKVYSVKARKWIRKQKRVPTKFCQPDRLRRSWEREAISEINKLLDAGFTADSVPAPTEDPIPTISQALERGLDIKKTSLTHGSVSQLSLAVKNFSKWLASHQLADLPLPEFKRTHAIKFLNDFMAKGYANGTRNNLHGYLSSLVSSAIEEHEDLRNPFEGIKQLRTLKNNYQTYTPQEVEVLSKYMLEHTPRLWLFTRFIYYGFARRKEVANLRRRNILDKTIWLPSSESKDSVSRAISILPPLQDAIDSMGVLDLPDDTYIFSKRLEPGIKPVYLNKPSLLMSSILRELGMYDGNKRLYGWKHTGVTAAFNAGNSIRWMQRQCGHSSPQMTVRYISDLGLQVEDHDTINW